ncbi:NADPH-dependent glutamate synthase [Loigolactobacillus jiayinensis]|uniref:NADPH-dependent glutamate synthase n=1 Tax=Loigolactobacillus jiayinensis TaxID=2486016 RepID=A0ABW1REJ1_9LACO|nr:NADPH-dependent glutamate synthase [Loigolactobacillus jiayinensis]
MPKRSYNKTPMREQAPEVRQHNFKEVALGYNLQEGQLEASRCLQCKDAPCILHCPVMIDIPGFIKQIKEDDMEGARKVLNRYTNLPAICGRVCPQEKQCEMVCRLGQSKKFEPVAIGKLERLVADWSLEHPEESIEITHDKGKVAIIGSGPSGLTAAGDLAKLGYEVVVFEALQTAGGVLTYGIPEFRLPKQIVQKEIDQIVAQGVKIETDMVVGKTITMDEIMEDFDACYIGVGAGTPHFMGIPGTDLTGVYASSEYLTRINLMHGYEFPHYDTPLQPAKNVVVIGGGNVAMDSARSAKRLGAETVTVLYRRSQEELPARVEEYHHSVEEDIQYNWLTSPVEYIAGDHGQLVGVKCIRMKLGEPDESGRRRPLPIAGSEFVVPADTAIEAIGQGANRVMLDTFPELATNRWGYVQADENTCATSVPGIFAGGDIVTGAATVILAMGAGKIAAKEIDQYVQNKQVTTTV